MRIPRSWRLPLMAAAVGFAGLLVFLPALANDFVNWDDPGYVYRNEKLETPGIEFVRWAFTTLRESNWHPLTWLSLRLDHAVWGKNPLGYHLGNVLLHALNSALVVLVAGGLVRRATGKLECHGAVLVLVVGAIFALHPLHVESVAWVSERKDLLYAFFWLASLQAYLAFTGHSPGTARARAYAAALLLFLMSLLSKPMAVTLPIVLLLLDFYPLRRLGPAWRDWRPVLIEKIPFLTLSAISGAVTVLAQWKGGSMRAMEVYSLPERAWGAQRAVGFYLGKTVAPFRLAPVYPLELDASPLRWDFVASFLAIVAITAAAVRLRRRAPVLLMAWGYLLVTLLPVLGIVQVGGQAAADRYMYLPILGPAAVMGALAAAAWVRWPQPSLRRPAAVAGILLAGGLAFLSVRQTGVWRNSETLWRAVIEHSPDTALGPFNLGNHYRDRNDLAAAREQWQHAIRIEPNHSLSLNQLGSLAITESRLTDAESYLRRSVKADPNNAEAHFNLALALEKLGRPGDARPHYQRFLEIAPAEYAHLFPRVRAKLLMR